MKRNRRLLNLLIFILVLSFALPTGANAAASDEIMPLASLYLTSYTSYICAMGNGDLQIWFRVTGTDDWAALGVLTIRLYESPTNTSSSTWTWVETFRHTTYSEMLGHDTCFHMSHVEYEGTPGMYYKAYVTIWAGDEDNNGDTRYIWTPVELCT